MVVFFLYVGSDRDRQRTGQTESERGRWCHAKSTFWKPRTWETLSTLSLLFIFCIYTSRIL